MGKDKKTIIFDVIYIVLSIILFIIFVKSLFFLVTTSGIDIKTLMYPLMFVAWCIMSHYNNDDSDDNAAYENIKIKYFDDEIDRIEKISKGDWIDLRSAETVHLKKGEFHLVPLGVGMKLPNGYEANIVPRSSTYKNFKVLQTNSFAVIDNSYSGDNDQWFYPVIAMEDTTINKNDRICQFRINEIQDTIKFENVDHLDNINRGGFGSTGK